MNNPTHPVQGAAPAAQQHQVPPASVAVTPKIYLQQEPYCLTEVEFDRIKGGQPVAITIFVNLLLTGAGAGLTLFGQAIASLVNGKTATLDLTAVWTAVATLVVAAIGWFGVRLIPGDYSRTMKAIRTHFKNTPITRHF
ncbi:hypothetical protein [Burkholderia sola]|uniref:hypothetical protein n=1 Tax=Burkholderia sola TaxID=2843302 RepID=UPI0023DD8875|nr:hypothetical protein [Burkholderia sola]MDF3081096.1 hypothetical protein [Burkholderia sola]